MGLSRVRHPEKMSERSLGLVRSSRLLSLAVFVGVVACDQNSTKTTSTSGVFFAPVALDVDEETGTNATTGEKRVEAFFTEHDILKAINPNQVGVNPNANPETFVLGKFSESEYVLFETESSTLLKADLTARAPYLTDVIPTDEMTRIFSRKPTLALRSFVTLSFPATPQFPAVNVVFGYETSSRSLFMVSEDVNGRLEVTILANSNKIEAQLGTETFNFELSANLAPGDDPTRREVVLLSSVLNQDGHLFEIRRDQQTGEIEPADANFRLFQRVNLNGDTETVGFISLNEIREDVTDNFDVVIFLFRPANIPNSQNFFIYENATSNFLRVDVERLNGNGPITGNEIIQFTFDGEVQAVLLAGAPAGTSSVNVELRTSFPLGSTIVAFEEQSNNMLSINYNRAPQSGSVQIYSSSNNLLERRDTVGVDIEFGLQEPRLAFGEEILKNNSLLLYDNTNDQLLGLNLSTSFYVVIVRQGDIARETGVVGSTDLSFMEAPTDNDIIAMDSQGNALLLIRVEYAAYPIEVF